MRSVIMRLKCISIYYDQYHLSCTQYFECLKFKNFLGNQLQHIYCILYKNRFCTYCGDLTIHVHVHFLYILVRIKIS